MPRTPDPTCKANLRIDPVAAMLKEYSAVGRVMSWVVRKSGFFNAFEKGVPVLLGRGQFRVSRWVGKDLRIQGLGCCISIWGLHLCGQQRDLKVHRPTKTTDRVNGRTFPVSLPKRSLYWEAGSEEQCIPF